MEDSKKPNCPNCGQPIEKAVYTIAGKVYCDKCRPSDNEEKTVAYTEKTVTEAPVAPAADDDKTVAFGPDHGGSPADAADRTLASEDDADRTIATQDSDRTLATEDDADRTVATQDIATATGTGLTGTPSRAGVTGTNRTRATTYYSMNKSIAATKLIKEVLKVEPDIDLEQASSFYFEKKGQERKTEASSIQNLISSSKEPSKYIFDKELGRGGMGAVFATVDQDIRRKVAMKVMLPGVRKNVNAMKRFLEEAQVTGQLEHPNIVPVHDIGIDEESRVYFTMMMVRGEDLESIVGKIAEQNTEYREKYTLGNLIQIFMKVCDGISYAHSKGVLHRDLKPENIMVGAFGEVMVMDWGLAKVLGREDIQTGSASVDESADPSRTLEGQVMGTPSYMSPEQACGKISELDERSDVFSLGGILYKILTYVAPYKGKSAREALGKAKKRQLTSPEERAPENTVPSELAAICMKAMARNKEDRYESATALKNDLQLYLDGRSVSAKKDNILVRARKWVVRNKVAAMGIAASVVCLMVGIVFMGVLAEKKKQDTITALLSQGESLRVSGKYEEAEETFFSVLGLDQKNAAAKKGIALVSGKALALKNKRLAKEKIRTADDLFAAGNYIKAYDAYVATFALDPESDQARAGMQAAAVKADRQKAQEKIKPLLADADELARRKADTGKTIALLKSNVDRIRDRIKGHEGYSAKKPLWEKEKTLLNKQIEKLMLEGRIISKYSAVLGYDGANQQARRAMAALYYKKYVQAEEQLNEEDMAYFRELTLAFDDGEYKALFEKSGTLTLLTRPPADRYYVYRYVEAPDRRMVPAPFCPKVWFSGTKGAALRGVQKGFDLSGAAFEPISRILKKGEFHAREQIRALELPKGSYLIIAVKEGYVDTRIPVLVNRGEEVKIDKLPLLKKTEIPEGFAYIPVGRFIMGGDSAAPYAGRRQVREAPGFLISKKEVTVGEYMEFVNYMEARLLGSGEKYLPRRSVSSGFYAKKIGSRYQAEIPSSWPVLGVSWNDAKAFCKYLTRKNRDRGWRFRLPEGYEWEKAARGVDGRFFPWGNYFDFSFCSMGKSKENRRDSPDAGGSFPLDESVYGLVDTAGNVSEWCATFFDREQNLRMYRGASWGLLDASMARCAAAKGVNPSTVTASHGFRIALTLKK